MGKTLWFRVVIDSVLGRAAREQFVGFSGSLLMSPVIFQCLKAAEKGRVAVPSECGLW